MSDTRTQIRDYYEDVVERVTADEILRPNQPIQTISRRRAPRAIIAVAAAALVVVVIGPTALWFSSIRDDGAVGAPPSTSTPATSLDTTTSSASTTTTEAVVLPDPNADEDVPAVPGEPFTFKYTIDDGRIVTVSWANANMWRWDYIAGGGSGMGPGSYQIYANSILYSYDTRTDEFLEERHTAFEGRLGLVMWDCDSSGVCRNTMTSDEGNELTCDVSPGGQVAGRVVSRYECGPTIWFPAQTLWVDNELGYALKSTEEGSFEVLAIDLSPSLATALFDQKCPTPSCTPAPD